MKNEFKELCESVNITLRQTKIMRYPKQIVTQNDEISSI